MKKNINIIPSLKIKVVSAFSFLFLFCSPILNASEKNHFNLYLSGIKAGELTYIKKLKNSEYSILGVMRSTGIFSVFAKYRFEGYTTGEIKNGDLYPKSYTEKSDTGKRTTDRKILYKNGIPSVISDEKRKPYWLQPSTQKNSLDPMTALITVLGDQTSETPCETAFIVYDGARQFSIRLFEPSFSKGKLRCNGLFTRLGGYSKKQLSKGKKFPFFIEFKNKGKLYEAHLFIVTTLRGRVKFVRD